MFVQDRLGGKVHVASGRSSVVLGMERVRSFTKGLESWASRVGNMSVKVHAKERVYI
jgi:hypothetical protein